MELVTSEVQPDDLLTTLSSPKKKKKKAHTHTHTILDLICLLYNCAEILS